MKALTAVVAIAAALSSLRQAEEAIRPVDAAQIKELVRAQRGKVVLLNFWATWCPPCIVEFPEIVALEKIYRKEGLVVISVSADSAESLESDLLPFLEKHRPGFPVYLLETDDVDAFVRAIDPDWKGSIPTTFFIDRRGKTAVKHFSAATRREMEELIKKLLKEASPAGARPEGRRDGQAKSRGAGGSRSQRPPAPR